MIAHHKNKMMRRMPAMPPLNASRRRILLGALLAPALIPACGKTPSPLRVGTNIWIGYESLYVAENRGLLARQAIRLITMRNASEVQQALHAGMLEAAAMSLDEALNLVEEGLDLRVVLVMDVSHGADVVLGQPGVSTLQDLRHKRVGVETSALGAVMLQACLEAAGLRPDELRIVDMGIDRHASAFREGEVDAVVTFEPVRSALLREGATLLFDSSMAPGRIVDVLVVTTETLERNPEPVRQLVEGHFKAIDYLRAEPLRAATIMRPRQQLPPEEIVKAFEGVRIPDVSENHRLLSATSGPPELESNADRLMRLMVEHRLLREPVSVRGLADGRFLPAP
jgi:NitT/TauT family transport system substrate-binding protein